MRGYEPIGGKKPKSLLTRRDIAIAILTLTAVTIFKLNTFVWNEEESETANLIQATVHKVPQVSELRHRMPDSKRRVILHTDPQLNKVDHDPITLPPEKPTIQVKPVEATQPEMPEISTGIAIQEPTSGQKTKHPTPKQQRTKPQATEPETTKKKATEAAKEPEDPYKSMDALLDLDSKVELNTIPKIEQEHQIPNFSQRRDYPVIIKAPNFDADAPRQGIYLMQAIKSSCPNKERRDAIRSTWGNSAWNRANANMSTKLLFLLAACKSEVAQKDLEQENMQTHDIAQWDFKDSFQNLTIKEVLFLQFVKRNVTKVTHIFKGDDDIMVNPVGLSNLISRQPDTNDIFIGSVLRGSPRILQWKSKYYVPKNLFSGDYYPAYVSGGGYVMSKAIADKLFLASLKSRVFPIDDAFVGVLLDKVGKVPKNFKKFRSWGNDFKGDMTKPCYWHEEVLTYHRRLPKELMTTWAEYLKALGTCNEDRRRRRRSILSDGSSGYIPYYDRAPLLMGPFL